MPSGKQVPCPQPAAAAAALLLLLPLLPCLLWFHCLQVFMGLCLLCMSALSMALTMLSVFLLVMAWVGVVVFTLLVAFSTTGAFVAGGAAVFFSGTCAVMGTTILSCACTAYFCQALFDRLKTAANTCLGTTSLTGVPSAHSQVPLQQLQAQAASPASPVQPAGSSNCSTSTSAPACTQQPAALTPQASEVAATGSSTESAVCIASADTGSHTDAPAAWQAADVAVQGGCMLGREAAGVHPGAGAAALGGLAGAWSPAVDAQLPQAIDVA
ncbi:hypothetical protein COO60DRAFT_1476148 [Scenedesmus sp. NREL 46B-D3]|nr:hypothetical protein COO60DRAFT_1476148 [Scenedesmus sp. NREL 46B-D3]